MSAIGPKQTSAPALQESAFGGKTDMTLCAAHVASDPKSTFAGQPGMKNNDFLLYYSNERARAKGNGYEPKYCFA
jgi:hypothetical protein